MGPGGPSRPVRPWGEGRGLQGHVERRCPPTPPHVQGEERVAAPSPTEPSPKRPRSPSGLAPSSPGPSAVHLLCLQALGRGEAAARGACWSWGAQQAEEPTSQTPLALLGRGLRPLLSDALAWATGLGNGHSLPNPPEPAGLARLLGWLCSVPSARLPTARLGHANDPALGYRPAEPCWGRRDWLPRLRRPSRGAAMNPDSRAPERSPSGLEGSGGSPSGGGRSAGVGGGRAHSRPRQAALAARPLLVFQAFPQPLWVPGG